MAPHVLIWEFIPRAVHEAQTRLAGNVLLWLRDDVTYRLEGDLDKGQMLGAGAADHPVRGEPLVRFVRIQGVR